MFLVAGFVYAKIVAIGGSGGFAHKTAEGIIADCGIISRSGRKTIITQYMCYGMASIGQHAGSAYVFAGIAFFAPAPINYEQKKGNKE